jgi:molybdopterin-biosynthesis enzyme MoeA-like protein
MAGVAQGVGRAVVRHPEIDRRLREFFKDKANEARLKMAEVPEGAELILDPKLGFPTVMVEDVYILPGIPELFEQKFAGLRERFLATPYVLRVVYTTEGEGAIAEHLNATLAAYPDLLLGSYPRLDQTEYAVKLTLESKDASYVQAAFDHLVARLPDGSVVRTE